MITYGIDVSHHQDPDNLPWSTFEGKVDFVIVRATYGKLSDLSAHDHLRRARDIGAKVGLYHFFRPTQPWLDQLESFTDNINMYCRIGDIAPVIDIEKDPFPTPGHPVTSKWDEPCRLFTEHLIDSYGDAIVYITQREWQALGTPQWVLDRPLWVAHYTSNPTPATPNNNTPHIWQHRVAPFQHNGPGGYDKKRPELDQNRGLLPLPTISRFGATHIFEEELDKGILKCFDYTPLDSEP